MRFSPAVTLSASCLLLAASTFTTAQADPYLTAVADAQRAVQCAQQELLLYRQVEFPRQVRQLNAAIELTKAEIDILRRRLREYAPFDKFQTGKPLVVTTDATRLHLLDARQRLADLEAERAVLYRYRGAQFRLLAHNMRQAQARVAALSDGEFVIVEQGL